MCTFSLYQPNDHADGGLSVDAQVKMTPFMRITTSSEVYDRLWVVHEADIAIESHVRINGECGAIRSSTPSSIHNMHSAGMKQRE